MIGYVSFYICSGVVTSLQLESKLFSNLVLWAEFVLIIPVSDDGIRIASCWLKNRQIPLFCFCWALGTLERGIEVTENLLCHLWYG